MLPHGDQGATRSLGMLSGLPTLPQASGRPTAALSVAGSDWLCAEWLTVPEELALLKRLIVDRGPSTRRGSYTTHT